MFNIKDKMARDDVEQLSKEFYEYRRLANDFKVETILPLKKQVGDLDTNMTTYIHQLQERIQQQDAVIQALMNHLGVVVHYVEPDHTGKYEILEKEKKDE